MEAVQVLLVDDHHRDLMDVAAMLEEAGFAVSTATNALQATRVLQARVIDVMIADAEMPGMSGLDLLIALRATQPNLPVIVMTSTPTSEGESTALALGAAGYLRKPVSVLLFLDAVARAASR